jgi:phospholipase/lecithinase/hemolysin
MFSPNFRRFVIAVVALAAFEPLAALAGEWRESREPAFEQVVVFGDSLSDPGNVFALTGQYSIRPFAPIPSAPYLIGGLHFTNGETWVERLSRALHSPTGAGPAARAPQIYTNFAFGGARARAGAASASPDFGAQVAMYFANSGGVANRDALYVVWFGANDVRDAIEVLAIDPSGATSVGMLQAAMGSIAGNVGALWAAGARKFLVPNVPNIGLTPALAAQPAQVRAAATQFSSAYNAGLAQLLVGLQAQLPDTQFVSLDVFSLLQSIVATPSVFGLSNATESCLRFGVVVGAICPDPRRYLFWDAIHPTAAVHRILAERAVAMLTP